MTKVADCTLVFECVLLGLDPSFPEIKRTRPIVQLIDCWRFGAKDILCAFRSIHWIVDAIQIKYGLPYCVTCPSMSTDPGSLNPGTRRSRGPGWWDPGIRTNTGAGDTVLENILNLYYSTGSWKLRGAMWVAAESGNLWSWALHTTHYYYNYQYFCIQWH